MPHYIDVNHEELSNLQAIHKLSLGQMASIGGLEPDQMRNILSGKNGTRLEILKRFGVYFRVPVVRLIQGGGVEVNRTSWRINSRKGLRDSGAPLVGDDFAPFQNFLEDEKGNRFAIAYMWTELSEDWIRLRPCDGGPQDLGDILRISYAFMGGGTVPNFAIHPQSLLPRRLRKEQRYLCFQGRVITTDATKGSTSVVGIRVGDANHFQWKYENSDAGSFFALSSEFQRFSVDLLEPKLWQLMPPASGKRNPDFQLLTTVVFDCGHGNRHNIQSAGESSIEIKNICIASRPDFVPLLPENDKRGNHLLKVASK